jgi:hypothetical protein
MAKINIPFNNQNYNIDESSFTAATSALRSHLSTVMNGSGATVKLGGTTYNIDSTKLTAATNDFIAHLGTIAGSGSKVVVGGTEYAINSAKLSGAIAEIETALGGLLSGGSGESDNTNDILDNTYPIEYNTKTLKEGNNTSFNYSNVEWKRVSALTPTVEELQQKVVRVAGYVGNYVGADTTMGAIVAQYQAGSFVFPMVVVPAATELFGASIPAGIYVNADVATNDSGYDVYFGDPEVADICDDTHPIEWNTKTVSENNSSFTLSGIQYVKVSNLVLTDDELNTKTFSVVRENGTVLNVSSVMTGQINGWLTLTSRTAAYQCSILVVPEASELDGTSISAGTYAKDMYASKGTEDTISVIDKA